MHSAFELTQLEGRLVLSAPAVFVSVLDGANERTTNALNTSVIEGYVGNGGQFVGTEFTPIINGRSTEPFSANFQFNAQANRFALPGGTGYDNTFSPFAASATDGDVGFLFGFDNGAPNINQSDGDGFELGILMELGSGVTQADLAGSWVGGSYAWNSFGSLGRAEQVTFEASGNTATLIGTNNTFEQYTTQLVDGVGKYVFMGNGPNDDLWAYVNKDRTLLVIADVDETETDPRLTILTRAANNSQPAQASGVYELAFGFDRDYVDSGNSEETYADFGSLTVNGDGTAVFNSPRVGSVGGTFTTTANVWAFSVSLGGESLTISGTMTPDGQFLTVTNENGVEEGEPFNEDLFGFGVRVVGDGNTDGNPTPNGTGFINNSTVFPRDRFEPIGSNDGALFGVESAYVNVDSSNNAELFYRTGDGWQGVEVTGESISEAEVLVSESSGRVLLYTLDANGDLKQRVLQADGTLGEATTISTETLAGQLVAFQQVTGNGQGQLVEANYVAAMNADGELILHTSFASGTPFVTNIADELAANGRSMPEMVGTLTNYVTFWGQLTIAGLDSNGAIQTVWTIGNGTGDWNATNLSAITGAPAYQGGLTTFVTSWGAINVVGVVESGDSVATWWVPQFGGDWRTLNYNVAFSSTTQFVPGTVAAYVTPWSQLTVLGIDTDGNAQAFWWVPQFEGNWRSFAFNSQSTPITFDTSEQLTGVTDRANTISVFGTRTDGSVGTFEFDTGGTQQWSSLNLNSETGLF